MRTPLRLSLFFAVAACALRGALAMAEEIVPAPAPARPEAAAPMPEAVPLTLEDCYRLALKQSETIAIDQERIRETEGRFLQALSGILPRASFVLSEKRQDGSGQSAFTLQRVPERRLTFSQPLFAGFKEFAAMAGSRAERRQRKQQEIRAEQLLLVDVADAFHLLLEQREDLHALTTTQTALSQRVDELKEREQLGRSRTSEVASALAQLRRTEAEIELVRSQEVVARQLLEFLTGLPRLGAIQDLHPAQLALEPEETYLTKVAARPDVLAAEQAWKVARAQVGVAQAAFWPTVNLDGNQYLKRAGVASDVDWDATLTVDVPLFQGGQAVGAVKEAASQARQAKLAYEQIQRAALLDIRDVYARLQAALARSEALANARDATEESYRLQVEDYRRSLVNNLEVLQELQQLQDARRDAIHADHEAKRLYWQLRAATGASL